MVAGNMDLGNDVEDLVDDLVEAFQRKFRRKLMRIVQEETEGKDPRWVDQSMSVLGPRTHIKACKRRLAENLPGARKHGTRRYLLSQEAIAEELGRRVSPGVKKASADGESDPVAELDKALARVGR